MNVNNSTEGNETSIWTSPIPVHTAITLYSILLVWSLLGNVLVIAVVYCNQNLRTNINYLIVNMAVSDLLIPLVLVPWQISWYMLRPNEWLVDGPLGAALCKLVPFLSWISPFVSSISLVMIAFQRFIAVVYPTRKQILAGHKARWIAMSFPWIIAMALFSPYFYTRRLSNEGGYTMCDYSWSPAFDFRTAQTIYFFMETAVGFAIPLIVIIILYSIIVYKLRKSLNNVMNMIEKETILSRQRRNRRIFSMLITIVVMFTICCCPYQVFALWFYLGDRSFRSNDPDLWDKIHFSFLYMWWSLAAINPCIYFMFLRDFRQGLKSLCCRKTASKNEPIPRRPRTPDDQKMKMPIRTQHHVQHFTPISLQSRTDERLFKSDARTTASSKHLTVHVSTEQNRITAQLPVRYYLKICSVDENIAKKEKKEKK